MTEEPATVQELAARPWHQRLTSWLFRYHRWFGLVSCVAVMSWGASGVMHPIMSRLNPQPVNANAPQAAPALHAALDPSVVLQRAGITEISGLRILAWNGASYYQVSAPSNNFTGQARRRYFEVTSGAELADGDAHYAESLARHFTGDGQSKTESVARLDAFDAEYMSVNRLLPVYRVAFARDDGLRAYVETSPPRLATLIDDRKELLGSIFHIMHNWDFMDEWDSLRMTLISVLLGLALLSALSGIWIYGFMWKRSTLRSSHVPLRRWHRGVGITVSLSALLFVISAEWHLLVSERRSVPPALNERISVAQLALPDSVRHSTWAQINLVQMGGHVYYQLQGAQKPAAAEGEHAHHAAGSDTDKTKKAELYVRADDGEVLQDGAREHAVWLAGQHSGLGAGQVAAVAQVSKFAGEYGFINKRLPVWRVDYATPEHLTYYVETTSGALAAVVKDSARWEGWSFSYLHKFHWLDFAGKNVRDSVMAMFGFGNLAVAVLGLWMFTRRYTRSPAVKVQSGHA